MLKNLYLTEDKPLPSSLMGYGPLSIRCKVEYHIWFYFIHQKFFPQPLKGPSFEQKNIVVVSPIITWYQINRRGWYCNHSFVASWWFSRRDVILKWNNKDKKIEIPSSDTAWSMCFKWERKIRRLKDTGPGQGQFDQFENCWDTVDVAWHTIAVRANNNRAPREISISKITLYNRKRLNYLFFTLQISELKKKESHQGC